MAIKKCNNNNNRVRQTIGIHFSGTGLEPALAATKPQIRKKVNKPVITSTQHKSKRPLPLPPLCKVVRIVHTMSGYFQSYCSCDAAP